MELLPWICQRLKSLAEGEAFLPFEVLMDASLGMFEHFKEKLSTQENINRRMWSPRGKLGLVRTFFLFEHWALNLLIILIDKFL